MAKKFFLTICWIINILFDLSIISVPVLYINFADNVRIRQLIEGYNNLFMIFGLITFGFWIYSLIVWYKKKDETIHLLLLIFLSALYTPFYYFKLLKSKVN